MIQLSRRARAALSVVLNSLALASSVGAFFTSYWCEGTHKVVKPPCLSVAKSKNCLKLNLNGSFGDSGELNGTQDPNAVHYNWETGDDKFSFGYFHTGFWQSCEMHQEGRAFQARGPWMVNVVPATPFSLNLGWWSLA